MVDWLKDEIIYQIFPERFNIGMGRDVFHKRESGHYNLPGQRVRSWSEKPKVSKAGEHQYDFWGGDLKGITEKLDYIKDLGVTTVYMTPIFWGHTNHKYDGFDYFTIDPDFGGTDDLKELVTQAHERGLKVVLDGVFNHVGRGGKWFNDLGIFQTDDFENEKRKSFFIEQNGKYRGWMNSENLLELNLENPELAEVIYSGEDSVIKHWLRLGIDGWRLDVAYDIGPKILAQMSKHLKRANPQACIVGEVWNYPAGWREKAGLDGIMNYYYRLLLLEALGGYIGGRDTTEAIGDAVRDSGLDYMSQSWNILSSHDVPRLRNELRTFAEIKLALTMQYTLPGVPFIYYGEELEMEGGHDPENRGPMEWKKLVNPPETYYLYKRLNEIRKNKLALRRGEFLPLKSSDVSLISFKRITDKLDELVVCLANPTDNVVNSRVYLQEGLLMNGTPMRDLLSGKTFSCSVGSVNINLSAKEALILEPIIERPQDRYSPYKRV